MLIWIDAQLSPGLASWLREHFALDAFAVRDVGLRDATDRDIFFAARRANATIMTKDRDFVQMLETHGPPPRVLWITCGNTSNARLMQILASELSQALELLDRGEPLVEVSDRWSDPRH